MAKPFYSMDEVCELLGKGPEEIKNLVREGTLREFRDAGKMFFKAEDVEQLSGGGPASAMDTSEIVLEPAEGSSSGAEARPEEPAPPALSSGGTSIIGLEPVEEEKDEQKEDTVITASGIGVFDDDELEIDADPMAKTQVTAGAIDDQVSLESSGSGSGLLDLTRESDDTSLGAELLDEIYPGEEEAAEAEPAAPEEPEAEAEPEPERQLVEADAGMAVTPVLVQVGDPYESVFSGFLVASLILLAVAATVVGGVLQGFLPEHARMLTNYFWVFLGGAAGVVLLCVLIGWFVGRAMTPKRG